MEQRHWHHSGVFIINFEHNSHLFLVICFSLALFVLDITPSLLILLIQSLNFFLEIYFMQSYVDAATESWNNSYGKSKKSSKRRNEVSWKWLSGRQILLSSEPRIRSQIKEPDLQATLRILFDHKSTWAGVHYWVRWVSQKQNLTKAE